MAWTAALGRRLWTPTEQWPGRRLWTPTAQWNFSYSPNGKGRRLWTPTAQWNFSYSPNGKCLQKRAKSQAMIPA